MKNLLQILCLIISLLSILSCAITKICSEDKSDLITDPHAKIEYTATKRGALLKKGCELTVSIKGATHEGTLIIRIKKDFSQQRKEVEKAVYVKALGQCCPRFEILTAKDSNGHQKRIVTNDERELALYKKRGAKVTQIYGDAIRYMKYKDNHEEVLFWFPQTKRMSKLSSTMIQKELFMDVFNFSYSDFFHAVEQLVDCDEIQFGREIISVKKRHFKELSPGIFLWLTSD